MLAMCALKGTRKTRLYFSGKINGWTAVFTFTTNPIIKVSRTWSSLQMSFRTQSPPLPPLAFSLLDVKHWKGLCKICDRFESNWPDGYDYDVPDLISWSLTNVAVLIPTSHDGMQWMSWGSGNHFILPVQTMLWKSKHEGKNGFTQRTLLEI